MSQYLLYSTISNQIKFEMGGQAPAEPKILMAVNAEIRNLNTKYDIDSFIRTASINVVTDGSVEYKIDDIITTGDVRKVKSIRYTNSDDSFGELVSVNYTNFMNDLESSKRKNQFTVYYKDGFQYIRVMTINYSDVVEDMTARYITSNLAIDSSGNFYPEIQSGGNLNVLLLDTYLDLVMLGAQKRLFYPSIGDTDQTQVSIVRNRYESELKKLGLSSNAEVQERQEIKLKLRKQW